MCWWEGVMQIDQGKKYHELRRSISRTGRMIWWVNALYWICLVRTLKENGKISDIAGRKNANFRGLFRTYSNIIVMEFFYKNSSWLKDVMYYRKKTPSWMFNWVLIRLWIQKFQNICHFFSLCDIITSQSHGLLLQNKRQCFWKWCWFRRIWLLN